MFSDVFGSGSDIPLGCYISWLACEEGSDRSALIFHVASAVASVNCQQHRESQQKIGKTPPFKHRPTRAGPRSCHLVDMAPAHAAFTEEEREIDNALKVANSNGNYARK